MRGETHLLGVVEAFEVVLLLVDALFGRVGSRVALLEVCERLQRRGRERGVVPACAARGGEASERASERECTPGERWAGGGGGGRGGVGSPCQKGKHRLRPPV